MGRPGFSICVGRLRALISRRSFADFLDLKQINVAVTMLKEWCTNVLHLRAEAMKDGVRTIRAFCVVVVA